MVGSIRIFHKCYAQARRLRPAGVRHGIAERGEADAEDAHQVRRSEGGLTADGVSLSMRSGS